MITQLDQAGFDFLAQHEGCVLHPYQDIAGVWTIGYGSTFYADGTPVKMGDPDITQEQAQQLLSATSPQYANAVHYWTVPILNQNQFNALFSFVYNIGTGGFKGSTVLKLVNQNDFGDDLKNAFLMWSHVNGVVNSDLHQRRLDEYNLFVS
jgi:lysozyme